MCKFNRITLKGVEGLSKIAEDVVVEVKQSVNHSLNEVEQMKDGQLPKRSYKDMISRVREKLSEESK
jgi:hypothetical protein